MNSRKPFPFHWISLAVIFLAIVYASKGAAFHAFGGLARIALPFVLIYFAFRWFRKKLAQAFLGQIQRQTFEGFQSRGQFSSSQRNNDKGQVIDLCPQCGEVKQDRHFCKR